MTAVEVLTPFGLIVAAREPRVTATGPRWAALDTAYTEWHELGRPERDRFGVTVGEQQWVRLDNPHNVIIEL